MRWVAPIAVLVAAGTVAGATAAPSSVMLIRPAQGIGKIRLGMTETELRRAMGRPRVLIRRAASFGIRTVDYEYGYGDYQVRLFGAPDRLRVVRVNTPLSRERTAKGIGPNSLERDLLRAYPAIRCQRLPTTVAVGTTYVAIDERTCTLFGASGRRTTFISGWRRRTTLVPLRDWPRRARVLEVGVAAAGR